MATFSKTEKDVEVRFWCSVKSSRDGCWEYTGFRNDRGYGIVRHGAAAIKAHRYSWMIHFGDPGELCVCHTCDNPSCVRPSHLFLGTHPENMRDMAAKGRGTRKISDERVAELRRRYAAIPVVGKYRPQGSVAALAVEFGLSIGHALSIARNKERNHINKEKQNEQR